MRLLTFILTFILIYSCGRTDIKDATIEYIEVYQTPFGVSGPLNYNEQEARTWTPNKIDERDKLDKIKLLLTLLISAGNSNFSDTNVYLTSDVHLTNGETKVLYYDKFKIKFDGKVYENSPALIEILASQPKSSE
ncbi:MAG: hypothetical protein AAF146_06410 [Bacteroidota bacterium]